MLPVLPEPRCFQRGCVHYRGVVWLGKEERSEANFCNAFSADVGGIPEDITYGDNLHLEPIEGQDNAIVFEKIPVLTEA